jgi:hypothetical protein
MPDQTFRGENDNKYLVSFPHNFCSGCLHVLHVPSRRAALPARVPALLLHVPARALHVACPRPAPTTSVAVDPAVLQALLHLRDEFPGAHPYTLVLKLQLRTGVVVSGREAVAALRGHDTSV